jgi:hypothetical protein
MRRESPGVGSPHSCTGSVGTRPTNAVRMSVRPLVENGGRSMIIRGCPRRGPTTVVDVISADVTLERSGPGG